jgi:hypothetical protein
MAWVIRGYLDFLAQKDSTYTDSDYASAQQKFSEAASEFVNVKAIASGLPTPNPSLVPTAIPTLDPCKGAYKDMLSNNCPTPSAPPSLDLTATKLWDGVHGTQTRSAANVTNTPYPTWTPPP